MLDYSINMEINWLSNDKFADNIKTNDNRLKKAPITRCTMNKLINIPKNFVSVLLSFVIFIMKFLVSSIEHAVLHQTASIHIQSMSS